MYSDMYTSVRSYGTTTRNSSLNIHIHADIQWHVAYTSVGSYGMTTKKSSLNIHIHADVQWHVHECGILRNDNKE